MNQLAKWGFLMAGCGIVLALIALTTSSIILWAWSAEATKDELEIPAYLTMGLLGITAVGLILTIYGLTQIRFHKAVVLAMQVSDIQQNGSPLPGQIDVIPQNVQSQPSQVV